MEREENYSEIKEKINAFFDELEVSILDILK